MRPNCRAQRGNCLNVAPASTAPLERTKSGEYKANEHKRRENSNSLQRSERRMMRAHEDMKKPILRCEARGRADAASVFATPRLVAVRGRPDTPAAAPQQTA